MISRIIQIADYHKQDHFSCQLLLTESLKLTTIISCKCLVAALVCVLENDKVNNIFVCSNKGFLKEMGTWFNKHIWEWGDGGDVFIGIISKHP